LKAVRSHRKCWQAAISDFSIENSFVLVSDFDSDVLNDIAVSLVSQQNDNIGSNGQLVSSRCDRLNILSSRNLDVLKTVSNCIEVDTSEGIQIGSSSNYAFGRQMVSLSNATKQSSSDLAVVSYDQEFEYGRLLKIVPKLEIFNLDDGVKRLNFNLPYEDLSQSDDFSLPNSQVNIEALETAVGETMLLVGSPYVDHYRPTTQQSIFDINDLSQSALFEQISLIEDAGHLKVISFIDDWDQDGIASNVDPLPLNFTSVTSDTDQDGLLDFEEFERGLDPLNPDSDGDGLNDFEELQTRNNPLLSDTDQDGVLDGADNHNSWYYFFNSQRRDVETSADSPTVSRSNDYVIYSGANGEQLFKFDGFESREPIPEITDELGQFNSMVLNGRFIHTASSIGDINNDDVPDLLLEGLSFLLVRDEVDNAYSKPFVQLVSGADQQVVSTINSGASRFETIEIQFLRQSLVLNDVDDDGIKDFVFHKKAQDDIQASELILYSGSNGNLIRVIQTIPSQSSLDQITTIGDLNGDGVQELLLSLREEAFIDFSFTIEEVSKIVDPISGIELHADDQATSPLALPEMLTAYGDDNGDGNDDYLVYSIDNDVDDSEITPQPEYGVLINDDFRPTYRFTLRSGSDASTIRQFNFDSLPIQLFSNAAQNSQLPEIEIMDDVNGDGHRDIALGFSRYRTTPENSSYTVSIYPDAYYDYVSDTFINTVGVSCYLDVNASVNEDNGGELCWKQGVVLIISGLDGSLLHHESGENYGPDLTDQHYVSRTSAGFGASITNIGDIDLDGQDDLLVGYARTGSYAVTTSSSDQDSDTILTFKDLFPSLYMDNGTDFDSDGISDFIDAYPTIYMDSTTDFDEDGVLDFDESAQGTDPLRRLRVLNECALEPFGCG